MATTPRRTLIRKAVAVGAVAIAVNLVGVTSPIASATPVSKSLPAIGSAQAKAAVKAAAASGYALPAKLAANCGSQN